MPLKDSYKRRLPLYGPLDIQNYEAYLKDSKELFNTFFNSPFPYRVKMSNFELISVLGEGAFGKVILTQYMIFEKSYYAVKCLKKSYLVRKKSVDHALNEKRILQNLNSPFCVRMEYFSQDNSYIYFFMPFIAGGELYTYLRKTRNGRLTEPLSRFYSAQVVLGLEYIHYVGLVYRDLKPENILIDHLGYLRITDFGFAKVISDRTYTFCGTPDYISPEVISGKGYGKAVDWWGLGVLLFELNSGRTPYPGKTEMEKYYRITRGKFEMPRGFSQDLQTLVSNLLQVDLTKRYGNLKAGPDDIKRHPWFNGVDWSLLLNRKVVPPYVPDDVSRDIEKNFAEYKKGVHLRISDKDEFKGVFEEF